MKDILSMLQSRIDKRANEIYYLTPEPQCPCPDCRRGRQDKIISEDVSKLNNIVEQQKFEKQVMAEIVSLRRKVSRNCEED